MSKLAAVETQSDRGKGGPDPTAGMAAADAAASHVVARIRLLMIVSAITTLIAIAAVVSVTGYRVYRSGGGGAAPTAEGTIVLPKGARVVASSVAGDRMVVTLDIGGATEIRSYDLKTLKETGRIRFATEP